jgi:hypothetical protein
MDQVFLSRKNLLTLLSKLDRKKNGEGTLCSIIKSDNVNIKFPQTMENIVIMAVEDEEYYTGDRFPGEVHPSDNPKPSAS